MKSIELFAGIGGIALAAEWAGIETVAFCEREPFCQKVLNKHWPSVPIFDDVCTLNKKKLEERGVDVGAVDIISGGYPCQPFSNAGDRKGEKDDRHLWPEVKRLLQEIRPTWFIGENVAGHITLGLDSVLFDLESIGYTWQPFVIPASAVGANHERYRVFILAHSNSKRCEKFNLTNKSDEKVWNTRENIERFLRNSYSQSESQTYSGISTIRSNRKAWEGSSGKFRGIPSGTHWQENQPSVCRMDDGISAGLDNARLKALGNAVVPQQIYPIFHYIKMINDKETQE